MKNEGVAKQLNELHSDLLIDANLNLLVEPVPGHFACFIRPDVFRAVIPTPSSPELSLLL